MNLKSKLRKIASVFTVAVMCMTMLPNVPRTSSSAANVGDKLSVGNGTNQHKGISDGYSYEVWLDTTGGSGSMTLGSGATFKAEWSASVPSGNFLARRGLDFGSEKKATDYSYIGMDYEADYRQTGSANGNSRLCVYGWFQNKGLSGVPLVEYYIIEDWVDWVPDAPGKMVTIDGAQYKIFQMDHTGPSINSSNETFKQYFSVRQSKRKSGHITVSDHFQAWANEGWGIGNLYEVALNAEGWQSSGVADITKLDVYTGVHPDPEPEPEPEPEEEINYTAPSGSGNGVSDNFEGTGTDWTGRGDVSYGLTSDFAHGGKQSLYVEGRTQSWNGFTISSNDLVAGGSYDISAFAGFKSNNYSSMGYTLGVQYVTTGTDTEYVNLVDATGSSGKWTELAAEFDIPSNAKDIALYIQSSYTETASDADCIPFFIDDVKLTRTDVSQIVTTTSTTKPVTTTTTTVNPDVKADVWGDANCDGNLTLSDAVLVMQVIGNPDVYGVKGTDKAHISAQGAANADVNMSGNGITNADALAIQKYLLKLLDKLPESVQQSSTPTTTTAIKTTTTTTTTAKPASADGAAYMDSLRSSITANVPANITSGSNNGCTEEKITYYSSIAKKNKNAVVILPPNYSTSKKYPVVYVNHGIFGSENDMVGYCKSIGGNLMASGEAEEMILVSCAMYTSENTNQCSGINAEECARYDAFREDLIECLMPYMEEHYSVATGRENTGICGFSMGGRESLYIGITRPQYFGYIGAACPAPGVTPGTDSNMVHPGNMPESEFKVQDHAYDPYFLMITGGTNDTVVGTFPKQYHEILTTNGQPHIWQEIQGGGHGDNCIHPLIYNFLKNAFKA